MPEALENLVVWQKAVALAGRVYRATEALPVRERFGLTSQLQRAGTSVASNIAEGYGRAGRRDFVRFLSMARGSAYEVFTQLTIARLAGIAVDDEVFNLVDEVLRILTGMINKLSVDAVEEEQSGYGSGTRLEVIDLNDHSL
jgi:four helix bundle protein